MFVFGCKDTEFIGETKKNGGFKAAKQRLIAAWPLVKSHGVAVNRDGVAG